MCRQHNRKPNLIANRKAAVLDRLRTVFKGDIAIDAKRVRIVELEQFVGRQAYELDIPKKSIAAAEWSLDEKRQVVLSFADCYPTRLVCRLLGIGRSSVY